MPLDSPTLEPAAVLPPLPYELARFARGLLTSPDVTAAQLEAAASTCRLFAERQVPPSGGVPAHWQTIADLLSAFAPVLRAMQPARRGSDAEAPR